MSGVYLRSFFNGGFIIVNNYVRIFCVCSLLNKPTPSKHFSIAWIERIRFSHVHVRRACHVSLLSRLTRHTATISLCAFSDLSV